ncbi:hypothetical protein STENM327S_04725 [Streptomyces tendae]
MTAVQLLIGLATLVVNAFFVAAEFALISVRRSQVEPYAEEGDALGRARAVGTGARVGADGGGRAARLGSGGRPRAPGTRASGPARRDDSAGEWWKNIALAEPGAARWPRAAAGGAARALRR